MKRLLATLLVLLLALGLCVSALAAGPGTYEIKNPYEDVIWSGAGKWGAFKANLHTHTTFSDGTDDLKTMAEEYYAQGYDVIANTDHGVVSRPWDKKPMTVFPLIVASIGKPNDVLSAARMQEINEGVGRGDRGMIQVPLGIEMNAATVYKSHVVGLYGGWGYGWFGFSTDYRISIAGTEKRKGVSIIAHPGDWIKSEHNPAAAKDPANVNFFAGILRDYPSCLGIEVYNG
ncbi:MAG: PHP domain-containing protein, partial [Oscillospiraceae bacterium]|nr:PHP domain-containing protein [Oscillospiraceae bacterium]